MPSLDITGRDFNAAHTPETGGFAALMHNANKQVFEVLPDAVVELGAQKFPALFFQKYERLDIGALGMASAQPALHILASDWEAALQGDAAIGKRLSVSRQTGFDDFFGAFEVAQEQPDGAGSVLLFLTEVQL